MKLQAFKKFFFEHEKIQNLCSEHGFQIRKGKFYFVAQQDNKKVYMSFLYNTWGSAGFCIYPHLSVSMDELFDIIDQAYEESQSYYGNFSLNMFCLETFYKKGEKAAVEQLHAPNGVVKFFVRSEENAEQFVDLVVQIYNDYGLRYVEDFGSIQAVDKIYNSKPTKNSVHQDCLMIRKASSGITAAKLLNNKNYSKLVKSYSKYMEDASEIWQKNWNNLLSVLENVSVKD